MKAPPITQPAWVTLLVFALAGLLVSYIALAPLYLANIFAIHFDRLIISALLLVIIVGFVFLVLPLKKGQNGKVRFVIGVGLALLGVALNNFAWSIIPYSISRLLMVVSLPFILSFLSHTGKSKIWLYLAGGIIGGAIPILSQNIIWEMFGYRQIGLFMVMAGLLLAVGPLIFSKNELPSIRTFTVGQMAAIIGICTLLWAVVTFLIH